jgi:methyl halide transferase
MIQKLDAEYWRSRYLNRHTGWDAGAITTPLRTYFDSLVRKDLRILVPGAGNAYEGEYLAKEGFEQVTVLDFVPEVIEMVRTRIGQSSPLKLVCEDFFRHKGVYDLVIEQTFFCALDPSLRKRYVDKMHELIVPGGELTGLLFTSVPNPEGPPFAASVAEYRQLFAGKFEIRRMEPCYNSIAPRAGRELFFTLTRK